MMNSNDYGYDSLVGDNFQSRIDYLPEEYDSDALAAIWDIVSKGNETSMGVKIATVYDRKGFAHHDKITGPKNPSYSSERDDIILQVTIRVDGGLTKSKYLGYEKVSDLIDRIQDNHKQAEIERIKKSIETRKEDLDNRLKTLANEEEELRKLEG